MPAAIKPAEKQPPNVIRAVVRAPKNSVVELIMAVENTPAIGDLLYRSRATQASTNDTVTPNQFVAAHGRVVRQLPTAATDIFAVVASIACFAATWEALIKVTVDGQERYRRYVKYAGTGAPTAGPIAGFTLNVV